MTQHRILRQVIEVDGCPPGTDALLRAQLGGLVQRHLLPVIARACDALDTPGQLWRAERLVLDLGALPLADEPMRPAGEDWGRALAGRLEDCLSATLAAALQPTPQRQADLELLAQFIATGTVPWWAPLDDRALVSEAVRRVLQDGPALCALGLDEVSPAWPRLLAGAGGWGVGGPGAADEASMWLDRLLPDAGSRALWRPWRDALTDALQAIGSPPQAFHALWWTLALPAAAHGRVAGQGLDTAALAHGLAAALAPSQPALWPAWRRFFDRRLTSARPGADLSLAPPASGTPSTDSVWWRALDGVSPPPQDACPQAPDAASASTPQPDQASAPLLADGRPVGASMGDEAGAQLHPQAAPALATTSAAATPSLLPARQASAAALAGTAGEAGGAATEVTMAAGPGEHEAGPSPAIDRRFADTDRIAVSDAGLVLLWPFLPAFFSRLGWLADSAQASPAHGVLPLAGRAFASPRWAARATALLHVLATVDLTAPGSAMPDSVVPEHLLPLARLLCGLPPETAPAWPMPADEDEAATWQAALAEGDLLLQAVIAQASILRAMSVPAFRASFLRRAGQLGVRDDHWLLRVERAAYDMVRDRFPWGVSVLRLPWMNATLQVEW